jgi:preprotein translocase subunit SecD
VTSVEHTIGERLGGLRLRKWALSRPEGAPSAQLQLLLPQEVDVDRVKRVIQSDDPLELKLVEEGPSPSKEALLRATAGQVPQHLEVLPGIEEPREGNPAATVYYLLQKTPVITGRDLRNTRTSMDEYNRPAVGFSLNQEGAQKLGKATGENIGRQLAIVLDGQVRSAPVIQSRITDEGQITGLTQQEIQDLLLVLRSAPLAAPVTVVEQRFVEGRRGP